MSNRLVKNGMGLVVAEETFLELKVTREGVQLKSPLPPVEVCKILQNISTDLMFRSFQPVEVSKIETV